MKEVFDADKEERLAIEYYSKLPELSRQLLKLANDFMARKDQASAKKLMDFCTNPEDIEILKRDENEFIAVNILLKVYETELQQESDVLITNLADNLGDIKEMIQTMKFMIWRFEFLDESEGIDNLINYVKSKLISPYFLQRLIDYSCLNPDDVGEVVANKFLKEGEGILALRFVKSMCMEKLDNKRREELKTEVVNKINQSLNV